jgi:CheY-like chemotaxis protein
VNTKPYEILVVDDDPIIRDMMVDILSFEGYPIHVARNGLEALEKMRNSTTPYLVFLDLLMPVMDGREVCLRRLTEPDLHQRHIVVLMSALDNIVEGTSLDINATLSKPFQVDDVMSIIELFLH